MTNATRISDGQSGAQKLLFLGYGPHETALFSALADHGVEVWHTSEPLADPGSYDVAVSFGYRHIISAEVLKKAAFPVINLHVGYLPYNRGTHPNFWSFVDNTPSGVTIHVVDEGIDTGPILYQRLVNFDADEVTFEQTHRRLIAEIEDLFVANMSSLLKADYDPKPQRGRGSSHRAADLPQDFAGWSSVIADEIARLDSLAVASTSEKMRLIDEIESVRTKNNVNWMNILRLAFRESPAEAKKIIRQIDQSDTRISELLKELGK